MPKGMKGFQKGLSGFWTGKKRPDISKLHRGEGNPLWRGEKVSYFGIHSWIKDNWGVERKCEVCGTENAKRYDWACLNHVYTRDKDGWKRMCRSCHLKHDYKMGFIGRGKKYYEKTK